MFMEAEQPADSTVAATAPVSGPAPAPVSVAPPMPSAPAPAPAPVAAKPSTRGWTMFMEAQDDGSPAPAAPAPAAPVPVAAPIAPAPVARAPVSSARARARARACACHACGCTRGSQTIDPRMDHVHGSRGGRRWRCRAAGRSTDNPGRATCFATARRTADERTVDARLDHVHGSRRAERVRDAGPGTRATAGGCRARSHAAERCLGLQGLDGVHGAAADRSAPRIHRPDAARLHADARRAGRDGRARGPAARRGRGHAAARGRAARRPQADRDHGTRARHRAADSASPAMPRCRCPSPRRRRSKPLPRGPSSLPGRSPHRSRPPRSSRRGTRRCSTSVSPSSS